MVRATYGDLGFSCCRATRRVLRHRAGAAAPGARGRRAHTALLELAQGPERLRVPRLELRPAPRGARRARGRRSRVGLRVPVAVAREHRLVPLRAEGDRWFWRRLAAPPPTRRARAPGCVSSSRCTSPQARVPSARAPLASSRHRLRCWCSPRAADPGTLCEVQPLAPLSGRPSSQSHRSCRRRELTARAAPRSRRFRPSGGGRCTTVVFFFFFFFFIPPRGAKWCRCAPGRP